MFKELCISLYLFFEASYEIEQDSRLVQAYRRGIEYTEIGQYAMHSRYYEMLFVLYQQENGRLSQ